MEPRPRLLRVAVHLVLLVALALPAAAQTRGSKGRRARSRSAKSARPASWPAFAERHGDWIRRKEAAVAAGLDGPDPLTQYLVSEVIVTGVFEADGGPGVFLLATPTGTTFFAAAGAALYNGRLERVNTAASGFVEDTDVVFVERSPSDPAERRVVKRIQAAPSPEPAEAPSGQKP